MNTTFKIAQQASKTIFQSHFDENNNEKSPNFKVYDILVWRKKEPSSSAYKLNYSKLNPEEISFKYSNWEEIELTQDIKINMCKFLKEPKLFDNEWIDCFLYSAYLKWIFNENDITNRWEYFDFWDNINNINPKFEKIKIKYLNDLYEKLKLWDIIMTWELWESNIHVSMYIWKWLFIWKPGDFPPYIYNLLELNKIPWMKFNFKKEISKINL